MSSKNSEESSYNLRFPIGDFIMPDTIDKARIRSEIAGIRRFPELLEKAVSTLNKDQLLTPYRPGGWNILQLVHHVSDSHINAYCRVKLALTEVHPTIRPYDQDAWSETAEANSPDLNDSLMLIRHLHAKWSKLLDSLSEQQYERTLYHPESKLDIKVYQLLSNYHWHGEHHLKHILNLKESMHWD